MVPAAQPVHDKLVFDVLAEVAAGTTARIELCRIKAPVDRAGRLVAVKRLHKHIAEDKAFADMFFDEVWMTAALHHPNVVDVAGWGSDNDGTYLAVELVQGVSLARLMKTVFETGEMFSERMVVYLGNSICAGLAAAHQLRAQNGEMLHLVHRDLTPGNVLVGFNGQIKIADFGLAKAKQRVTKTLTGTLKGHPQYMAPEMARGVAIDHRADLFSLGVVLFELFAGQHPWPGSNELEIIRVMTTAAPKDLMTLRPKLDRELANVVNRLLEKDPAARFQSADEARARLLTWLDAHGYAEGNDEALGRFVRRNAMRQMRWFERAIAGELKPIAPPKRDGSENRLAPVTKPPRIQVSERTKGTSPPRLRRRRSGEDQSDIADLSAKASEHELGRESIDWGEEVPTVVQKKDPSSFIDEEDSDGRTTQQNPAIDVKALPPPPNAGRPGAPRMLDPPSDEIPTVPVARERAQAEIARVGGMRAPAGSVAQTEAARLAQEAKRLREEAEEAAEAAAQWALLAKLAQDAAALAAEAVRAEQAGAPAKAQYLIQDAQKLEETLAKQAASPGAMLVATELPRGVPKLSWVPEPAGTPSQPPPAPMVPQVAQQYVPLRDSPPVQRSRGSRSRRGRPSLLDQKLWGIRISTAIAFVAAFVIAMLLLILIFSH